MSDATLECKNCGWEVNLEKDEHPEVLNVKKLEKVLCKDDCTTAVRMKDNEENNDSEVGEKDSSDLEE